MLWKQLKMYLGKEMSSIQYKLNVSEEEREKEERRGG